MKTVAEAFVGDGDDEVLELSVRVTGHVLGEAVAVQGEQVVPELLGEVSLGVEVDEEDAKAESGEVFQLHGCGVGVGLG